MSTSPDLVDDGMSTEVGVAMFNDVVARFVDPELKRRLEGGTWTPDDPVVLFQVVFPYGAGPEVRINRGIGGTLTAKATRVIEAGEEVCPEDFSEVAGYEPAEKDRGLPHITGVLTGIGWHLVFELGTGHPKRHDYLARAEEFLETARDSLRAGRLAAFADNAFSATELLARGELLAYAPTVDIVLDTKDHGVIASTYKLWADLGNTEKRFARLLKQMNKGPQEGSLPRPPLGPDSRSSKRSAASDRGDACPRGRAHLWLGDAWSVQRLRHARLASWRVRRAEGLRLEASASREPALTLKAGGAAACSADRGRPGEAGQHLSFGDEAGHWSLA